MNYMKSFLIKIDFTVKTPMTTFHFWEYNEKNVHHFSFSFHFFYSAFCKASEKYDYVLNVQAPKNFK